MKPEEYDLMRDVEDHHWWYRGLRTFIADRWAEFGPPPGARILDLGCGTGANMAMARQWGSVTGADIEWRAVHMTRDRGLSQLVQADALRLPFKADAFDAVLGMDLLYHRFVPNQVEALREIATTLRPGGRIFVNVPAYQWLYSSHDESTFTGKRFTRREMVRYASEAGLETVWAGYWNTTLFPPIVGIRMMRKWTQPKASDLGMSGGATANRIFGAALGIDRALTRIAPLPFGLSIFLVLEKP